MGREERTYYKGELMNRALILANLEDLRTLNNWFDIKDINDIPEMHIQMAQKHFSRLNRKEQDIVWQNILNDYRKPYLPNEQYYKSMVGMYLNDVIPLRKDRSKYTPLTEQEKIEVATAAREAREKFEYQYNMIYSNEDKLESQREEEARKNAVKMHRKKQMEMVKAGMVELTTHESLHERLRNGPIWIKKSEAIAQGLSEKNGDFRCHRERYVKEVESFGRIGKVKI